VPVNGNGRAVTEGDTLRGLGAADMKSGVAVLLELARTVAEPACDVSYVFYAAEEVEAVHNGLEVLFRDRPDLLAGDAAILGEPTDGTVEAGCQGTLRLAVRLAGRRPTPPARGWASTPSTASGPCWPPSSASTPAPRARRLRVPRGAPGGAGRGWRGRQRRARRRHDRAQHRFAPDRSAGEAERRCATPSPLPSRRRRIELLDAAPSPTRPRHPLLGRWCAEAA
jgi:succinyl-diaminopimelate desuccinylase